MDISAETLEEVKEAMCEDYCFYATITHQQEVLDQHCEECPLNKLGRRETT